MKHSRKYMRAEITKTYNLLQSSASAFSTSERKQTHDRLIEVQKSIQELDSKISLELFKLKTSEEETQKEYDTCLEYGRKIHSCISELAAVSADSAQSVVSPYELRNQLKLPQLPLPEYGHREGEDLNKFLVNFESIISKYGLSSYEKFVFLQRQLKNEALTLVSSLEAVNQNYECAKQLLQKAFASTLTQQYEAISRLSKLKLAIGDDPFEYVSKMRLITESFNSLKIDSSLVLQFFIWQGMNENMQTQLIQITNKHRPSLEDINKHIFDAIERYNALPIKARNKIRALEVGPSVTAVNVTTKAGKLQYCSLCSGRGDKVFSHSTYSCTVYPTVRSKIDKLKELHGCTKCGNLSHEAETCKFRFNKRCVNCSKYHFGFLCTESERTKGSTIKVNTNFPKNSRANKIKPVKSEVNNNSVYISQSLLCGEINHGTDTIIPTFTLSYGTSMLRGMRDGGCQPCFVTSKFAKEQNLDIVEENIELVIKGFNSNEKHCSNVVQLKFDFLPYPIEAITVPEIRTRIVLPGLSEIARQFLDKGYNLADSMLTSGSDVIENLDFILGNSEAQIMPQKDFSFGKHPLSSCSYTDFGVLLSGSVTRLKRNLPYLNKCQSAACLLSSLESDSNFQISRKNHIARSAVNVETSGFSADGSGLSNYAVLDEEGNLKDSMVELALNDLLSSANQHYETEYYNDAYVENDEKLVNLVFSTLKRSEEGRIILPLLWNSKVYDSLSSNYNLSKLILDSNMTKLSKRENCLEMYDKVVRDQLDEGIIEKIEDLSSYLREHPNCSFMPHMGVFKLERQSSKCRIVFLSNLCERGSQPNRVSHNQAMLSGPNLNKTISTSLIKLRFDRYLLCFDLRKAFQSIELNPIDQDKLLFLWYRNIGAGDFSIIGYKNLRLAFGLRCSPALLMLALYYILVLNTSDGSQYIKHLK